MSKRRRNGRNVHGVVLLDKPNGISSNAALQKVKYLFQAQKAGHTGSLDNLATGLLPICLGEATKISQFLLDADKRYIAECQLGVKTTTGDMEGEIVETRSIQGIDRQLIDNTVKNFIGQIAQVPPMYSALKYQGQPLYKLARQGQIIERKQRLITIFDISVENFVENRLILQVHCSKGTYIRTLAEDIGEALGCGATITALKRIQLGQFCDMIRLETLQNDAEQGLHTLDKFLISIDKALNHLPKIVFSNEESQRLQHGQKICIAEVVKTGWIQLFGENENLFGIGQITTDGDVVPKRLFNF